MNPFLIAVAVGLVILNITVFVGITVSPPRPAGSATQLYHQPVPANYP